MSNTHAESVFEEASRIVKGDFALEPKNEFPEEVNRRLPISKRIAQQNLQNASLPHLKASLRFLYQSRAASTKAKKYTWLEKAADQFSQSMAPAAACKKGCSHCCHIPVAISRFEATRISQATGAPMNAAPAYSPIAASYLSPCTFLQDNQCSIYEHRPISCKTYLNLDSDSLLCQLVEGTSIPLPLADSRQFTLTNFELANLEIKDIRHWFGSVE